MEKSLFSPPKPYKNTSKTPFFGRFAPLTLQKKSALRDHPIVRTQLITYDRTSSEKNLLFKKIISIDYPII